MGATRRWLGALSLASMAGLAGYALAVGQDINFDSRNYHFYLPWALFENRIETDFEAAGVQTFLNPLPYLPYQLLVGALPPRAAAMGLASLQALSLIPVYLLALHLLPAGPARPRQGIALLVTMTGATAPFHLAEAGTSFVDGLVSLPILAAVWIACRALDERAADRSPRWIETAVPLSGALVGAATGLKLTNTIYAIGFMAALAAATPWRVKGRAILAALAGMAAGWVLTGGAWSWRLWARWRNPLFPFFNDVFGSPFYTAHRAADQRFLPASFSDALGYPFQWAAGGHPSAEVPFRDARFAVILVLAVVVLIGLAVRSFTGRAPLAAGRSLLVPLRERRGEIFLMVFFAASGVVWLRQFAIQRYIVTLELLSGILLLLVFVRAVGWGRRARVGAVLLLLIVVAWGRPASYGRIPWGDSWFGVEPPAALNQPDTLFLLFGYDPVSFVAPFLPSSARLVRLTGSMGIDMPLGEQAVGIVGAHDGPLRTLTVDDLSQESTRVLTSLSLALVPDSCQSLPTRAGMLRSCEVRRTPPARLESNGPPGPTGGAS